MFTGGRSPVLVCETPWLLVIAYVCIFPVEPQVLHEKTHDFHADVPEAFSPVKAKNVEARCLRMVEKEDTDSGTSRGWFEFLPNSQVWQKFLNLASHVLDTVSKYDSRPIYIYII